MPIRRGEPPECLAMWGVINYRDAFGKPRYTKFAFIVLSASMGSRNGERLHGNLKPEEIRR